MTGQTSARIGLPVMLAFVVAFGVILATNSGQYEVSPPTRTVKLGFRRVGPESIIRRTAVARTDTREQDQPVGRTAQVSPREWTPSDHGRGRPVQESGPQTANSRAGRPPETADRWDESRRQATPSPRPRDQEARAPRQARADTAKQETELPVPKEGPAKSKAPQPLTRPAREARPAGPTPATKPPERSVPPERKERKRAPDELERLEKQMEQELRTVKSEVPVLPSPVVAEAPTILPAKSEYVIKRGDNLIKICKALYGTSDAKVVQALYEANRDRLKNKNLVMVNQSLRTPPYPSTRIERTRHVSALEQQVAQASPSPNLIKLPEPVDARPSSATGRKDVWPSRSMERPSEKQPTGKQRYRWYRVKRNESLSKIAAKTLGDGRQ